MCRTVSPTFENPCFRPAGTMTSCPARQRDMLIVDPHVGLSLADAQNFLDRMQDGSAPHVQDRTIARTGKAVLHCLRQRLSCGS